MSAIDLYFSLGFSDPENGEIAAPIEYELTHKLMLYMLMQKTDLTMHLLGTRGRPGKIKWDPTRKYEWKSQTKSVKFDLVAISDKQEYCIEIKILANSLSGGPKGEQFQKYTEYLQQNKEKAKGYYVLLGGAGKRLLESGFPSEWGYVGHDQLDCALEKIQERGDNDMSELISAYRNALKKLKQKYSGDPQA